MAQTIIGLGNAMAVKRFSGNLFIDVGRKGYFTSKYMGKGKQPDKPIWQMSDLEKARGDQVTFDLSMQLNMEPVLSGGLYAQA